MEKVLLISRDVELEKGLADLLESPRLVARISSWQEAHRVISKSVPRAVFVGAEMFTPAQITELVGLDSLLNSTKCKAYLFAAPGDTSLAPFPSMFSSLEAILALPQSPRDWQSLRPLLRAHISGAQGLGSPSSVAEDKKVEVVVRLPVITSGDLSTLPLPRLLYSLQFHGDTGILHLRSGPVHRRFGIVQGRFTEAPAADNVEALMGAFAWPDGQFQFEPRNAISGTPAALYPILKRGLSFRPQRQIMDALMPRMATFPTPTNLWADRQSKVTWPVLHRFLAACDGKQSLEKILSAMGRDVTEAFQAALVAGDTDLLLFRSKPSPGIVHVQYDREQKIATTTSPSSPGDISKDRNRLALKNELQTFHTTMTRMTPHQIFGVWKGCGREVVKETFYKMVKEHHPDVYGGNVSPEIRDLAQKIFIGIRGAYAELIKVEGAQTVAAEESTKQQPGRKKLTTLRPGQVSATIPQSHNNEDPRPRTPQRTTRLTTPIEMGRTPTNQHPDLKSRGFADRPLSSPGRSTASRTTSSSPTTPRPVPTPAEETTTDAVEIPPAGRDRTASLSGARRRRRTSSSAGATERAPSSPGLEENSDPEWRREQMARLNRKPSRRPTPIAGASVPPPADIAQTHFNQGYQLFKDADYRAALLSLEKAHDADKKNALYATFYAYCLFQVDPSRANESRELLREALKSESRQARPDAHLFLGKILKVLNKPEQAQRHFQEALRLNPNSRDAEREIKLYEKRNQEPEGGLFKRLFKK